MADKTIDQLPQLTGLASDDELVIWDIDGGSTNTKKITLGTLLSWMGQQGLGQDNDFPSHANVAWGVKSRTQASPPPSPSDGDKYLVASGATGAWSGHDNEIAVWDDSSSVWNFYQLNNGDLVWVIPEDKLFVKDDSGLVEITNQQVSISNLQNIPQLGINAIADISDRLVVSTTRAIFDDDNSELSVVINATDPSANKANLVFASNMSYRYVFSLEGNDLLKLSKSGDGVTFDEIFTVNLDSRFVFPSASPFSIESSSVNLYGQDDGVIDIIRKSTGDSGNLMFSTASPDSGKGLRIRSDADTYLKIDKTDDHTNWDPILHVKNNGNWFSNQITWETVQISFAPNVIGPRLELVKNQASDRCQLRFVYGNKNFQWEYDSSDNLVLSEYDGSNQNNIVSIHSSDHTFDFGNNDFKIDASGINATNSSGSLSLSLSADNGTTFKTVIKNDGSGILMQTRKDSSSSITNWRQISVDDGSITSFVPVHFKSNGTDDAQFVVEAIDAGASTIHELKSGGGNFNVRRIIDPSNTTMEYQVSLGGPYSTIYSYDGNTGVFDYKNLFSITANEFSFVGSGGLNSFSVDVSSVSIDANCDIAGNISVTGAVNATGHIISENDIGGKSVHIKRTVSSDPLSIIFDDNNNQIYKQEVEGNSTNVITRVSNDGGSSWNNHQTIDTQNNKVTQHANITFEGKTDFEDVPYLEAYNSSTQSFGTNSVETLSFDTTFKSNDINIAVNNKDFTVLRDGIYKLSLTLITSSGVANNNDEWQILVQNSITLASQNVASAAAFWPNRGSSVGTKERWVFEFVIPASLGDIFKINIQDISSNADVIVSHITMSRCV